MGISESHRLSLGRRLHIIHRWMRDFISEELKDTGIGAAQFPFLLMIFQREGTTQEQLTQKMKVDKATTARAVKKLVSSGYVKRERNPDDQRAYSLYPTDKAWRILPRLRRTMRKWTETLTQPLSKEEGDLLREILDKIIANAPCMKEGHTDGE